MYIYIHVHICANNPFVSNRIKHQSGQPPSQPEANPNQAQPPKPRARGKPSPQVPKSAQPLAPKSQRQALPQSPGRPKPRPNWPKARPNQAKPPQGLDQSSWADRGDVHRPKSPSRPKSLAPQPAATGKHGILHRTAAS